MKIFIWKSIEKATDNYHEGGGLAVIAISEEKARLLAAAEGAKLKAEEKPDFICKIVGADEMVMIFPNSGCC